MLTFLFLTTLTATQAQQPQNVPALSNAEACLRENVSTAVRSNESALDAADFLLSYLCAGPVGIAAQYQLNVDTLAAVQGMADDWPGMRDIVDADADADGGEIPAGLNPFGDLRGVYVDTTSGEFVIPEDAPAGVMVNALRSQNGAVMQLLGEPRPAFLRELAGQLVLQAKGR